MPSLKEIKNRISSVKSTQKITSAMKMVSSAKLRKAQSSVERFLPYQHLLGSLLSRFAASGIEELSSPLLDNRPRKRVSIVALSSNSSLCGAFNANILKSLNEAVIKYHSEGCEIDVYPVGKKIEEAVRKSDLPATVCGSYISLIDKPDYASARSFADSLINRFRTNETDLVVLLYNHFKNAAVQIPTTEQFLPLLLEQSSEGQSNADYLIEPDRQTLFDSLLPKSLRSKIYAVLLDSSAAEQAARTMAMQIATDNAEDILSDLSIQFNKQRQQSITSELLDIVGGSEALK